MDQIISRHEYYVCVWAPGLGVLVLDQDPGVPCVRYLGPRVLFGPGLGVGLGVLVQDVVEVMAGVRRLHVSIQDGRRPDHLGVEPAGTPVRRSDRQVGKRTGRRTDGRTDVLLVGLLALYETGPLQGDAGEQSSGAAVGEHGRRAAQRHIRLHVPTDRQTDGESL